MIFSSPQRQLSAPRVVRLLTCHSLCSHYPPVSETLSPNSQKPIKSVHPAQGWTVDPAEKSDVKAPIVLGCLSGIRVVMNW